MKIIAIETFDNVDADLLMDRIEHYLQTAEKGDWSGHRAKFLRISDPWKDEDSK